MDINTSHDGIKEVSMFRSNFHCLQTMIQKYLFIDSLGRRTLFE